MKSKNFVAHQDTRVVAGAILSPGVTSMLLSSEFGLKLHVAVDRMEGNPNSILLTSEETQVLVNMLMQFSESQAKAAQEKA